MSGELIFGLDLGLNNVGWCAITRLEDDINVLAMGTYVFESPLADINDPSKGMTSADRGSKRRTRRTLDRRHQRKMRLYRKLGELGLLPKAFSERSELLCRHRIDGKEVHPYALRARALTEQLEPLELGRVLCHLNQRRGFLSPRDLMLMDVARFDFETEDEKEKDSGKILGEIKDTRECLKEGDHPTIGSFLYQRLKDKMPVRKKKLPGNNSAAQKKEDLRRFVRANRTMIEQEFNKIVEAQQKYHPLLTDAVIGDLRCIIFSQLPLQADEGTRGKCTFYNDELRAPRAGMAAQRFVIVQEVANLKVSENEFTDERKLTPDERKALMSLLMKGHDLSWPEVKKALALPATAQFNIEPLPKKKKGGTGTKQFLKGSKTISELRACAPDKWDELGDDAQRDIVGEIISTRDWIRKNKPGAQKTGDKPKVAAARRFELLKSKSYGPKGIRFTEQEAAAMATVSLPPGYLNLSTKAIRKLVPNMLKGMTYDEACQAVGLNHSQPIAFEKELLKLPYPTDKDIGHPLVRCSVRNAVRVLNTLRWEYGLPHKIHIELPRDLAKSAKQRDDDDKKIKQNEAERKRIIKEIIAVGLKPNETNIKKVRLWEEAGARLPYEPEIVVGSIDDLLKGDYQIDHIVPRSCNYDNSFGNLALCTADFNIHTKGNKTLWEAIGKNDPERWKQIETHVKSLKGMKEFKRQRILAKELPEGGFTGRHLSATGYISREVLALAQQMVREPIHALVVPGRATGDLRYLWELDKLIELHPEEEAKWTAYKEQMELAEKGDGPVPEKPKEKQRSNFLHHALDALIVALTDEKTLLKVTNYYKWKDSITWRTYGDTEKAEQRLAMLPDPKIREKAIAALRDAVVVHRPNRKATGELHKQMPVKEIVETFGSSEPWTSKVIGKHLVQFGPDGKAAQAYPLGNNHHVVIWERTTPNAKGIFERYAEVIPTIEAVRRRAKNEPVIRKHHPAPGWRFVMALCKGDTVEMMDGGVARVSKFSAKTKDGDAELALWNVSAAAQAGKLNADNPYVVAYIQTANRLREIRARIVSDPLGRVLYREGLDE